jgi:hypothetical protein
MKKPAAPARVIEVSAAQLRRLDARLRARELQLRAEGKLKPRLLVDPKSPGVRLHDPYRF